MESKRAVALFAHFAATINIWISSVHFLQSGLPRLILVLLFLLSPSTTYLIHYYVELHIPNQQVRSFPIHLLRAEYTWSHRAFCSYSQSTRYFAQGYWYSFALARLITEATMTITWNEKADAKVRFFLSSLISWVLVLGRNVTWLPRPGFLCWRYAL